VHSGGRHPQPDGSGFQEPHVAFTPLTPDQQRLRLVRCNPEDCANSLGGGFDPSLFQHLADGQPQAQRRQPICVPRLPLRRGEPGLKRHVLILHPGLPDFRHRLHVVRQAALIQPGIVRAGEDPGQAKDLPEGAMAAPTGPLFFAAVKADQVLRPLSG
jgi:hypothetical protein